MPGRAIDLRDAGPGVDADAVWETIAAERRRIARDLHDTVSQTLYALVLSIETAAASLDGGGEGDRDSLGEAGLLARQAMSEVRRAIWGLPFPELRAQGLASSVRALAAAVQRESGVEVAVKAGRLPRVDAAFQEVLFRAAREALINAVRHARCRRVAISLDVHEGDLALEVTDDGVGLGCRDWRDVAGFGLRALASAVEDVGGTFEVLPGGEGGLRLHVRVPVRTG